MAILAVRAPRLVMTCAQLIAIIEAGNEIGYSRDSRLPHLHQCPCCHEHRLLESSQARVGGV